MTVIHGGIPGATKASGGGAGGPNTLAGYDNTGAFSDVAIGANLSLVSGVLSASGGGLTYNEVTTTTVALAVNNGYVMNNSSTVVGTLPSTAAQFSIIRIFGKGAGGWSVAQNAGQTIHFDGNNTTTGTGGSLSSQSTFDCMDLLCITANTDFLVTSSIGNITGV